MKTKILFLGILLGFSASCFAQVKFYRDTNFIVDQGGTILTNAWAGGINTPVFASIDLNGDNKMDMVVFDWSNEKVFRLNCYVNEGLPGKEDWRLAAKYNDAFPKIMEGWIRTYDYDCDGDMDLFTYEDGGYLGLYRNDYTSSGGLKFTLITNQVQTYYGTFASNLYVTRIDMPAMSDIDGDGDMDVLGFSISGNYLEHNKNLALEKGYSCSNISNFNNIPFCWGYFE